MNPIRITIDGRVVEVEKGMTILEAARRYGIYIPTLCDFAHLTPHGSCRLCIVEVEGSPKTPTSCTTPAEQGMVVRTQTPRLHSLRAELLRMFLSEHPVSCLICPEKDHCDECMITLRKSGVTTGCRSCPKDGLCELQELVERIGLDSVPTYPVHYRNLPVEKNDPFFDRDYNLCILCGRCVRICEETHFSGVLTYINRGNKTIVGTAFGRSHLESGCSFCGACVEVCPTGALVEKYSKWDGRADGEALVTCPLCSLNCSMRLQTKKGEVIKSLPTGLPGEEQLCVEGRFGIPELVNHPSRLRVPQIKDGVGWRNLNWDEAAQLIAEKLFNCPPDNFGCLISASCSNEDLYIAQKFTRVVMRTHQISTPIMDIYGMGMSGLMRLLKQSVSLDAIDSARAILCVGLDTRYSQSVVEPVLVKARQRGASIISLHPYDHSLAIYADEWLQPNRGEEYLMIADLIKALRNKPIPHRRGAAETVISQIKRSAGLLRNTPVGIIIGPTALTSPANGSLFEAIEEMGKELNAMVIPLPVQGNLSGSIIMGAYPNILPGGVDISDEEHRLKVSNRWSSPLPLSGGDSIFWKKNARLQVLLALGENPPLQIPDTTFVITQNIYPPQEGRVDLLLPMAAFSEMSGSWINYAGQMNISHKVTQPKGEALPSWEMLCRIARLMGARGFDFTTAEEIQAEISRIVSGFWDKGTVDRFNMASGISYKSRSVNPIGEHDYLGYPLNHWIEGLQILHIEK
ncbi:MAG: 2Fe-2S iron-sulfur cluster-binding protein [Anaerolineales bacterium]